MCWNYKTIGRAIAVAGLTSALASGASAGPRVQVQQIPGSLLPVVKQSRLVGAPALSKVLHLSIGLRPRFPAELKAFGDSVSDPSSPNYRQFMTPSQVGESFGAGASDVDSVVAYLKGQGMKITLVSPNRMAILADCTVAQAQNAFAVQIRNFQGADPTGRAIAFYSNVTPIQVPSSIAGTIQVVNGLANYVRPHRRSTLTPPLARGLYNTAPSYAAGFQGQGRKIGFSNWDNISLSDANAFINFFSLPIPGGGIGSNIHVVVVGGGNSMVTAGFEGNLDLQMELSAAPLADIYIYDNDFNVGDLLGVVTREASDNLADIISESYGWYNLPDFYATSVHNQHLAMTAQGQTYLAASGDFGTADYNLPGDPARFIPDPYPGADPDVTNVGGTIATVNGVTGARISEVTWSGQRRRLVPSHSGFSQLQRPSILATWNRDPNCFQFQTHPRHRPPGRRRLGDLCQWRTDWCGWNQRLVSVLCERPGNPGAAPRGS